MLPDHVLSSQVIAGTFLPPKDVLPPTRLIAYEIGGVALRDPSQGLLVKIWTAELIGNDVMISAPGVLTSVLFTRSNITELSLTFDQNMNPFVAFVQADVAKFWWYDPTMSMQVFTDLPAGSISPRATLDDKRLNENGTSDIILGYLRDNTLYFRAERDRYLTEYTLEVGLSGTLSQIGMSRVNRLQFLMEIRDDHPCSFG